MHNLIRRIETEINNRLAKANGAFGRLYGKWSNEDLRTGTKVQVYTAVEIFVSEARPRRKRINYIMKETGDYCELSF